MNRRLLGFVALALLLGQGADAQTPRRGILDREAPSWGVTEWINLPDDRTTIDVEDFRGRVLYLYGFQSWCPGCHRYGFPTLRKLLNRYRNDDDVAFVAVQTVFEGFGNNTADQAWETAQKYDLEIPVGHDGTAGKPSILMQRYRTGGTPWVVIIDKQGRVRFNDFHIQLGYAHELIDSLRAQPAPAVIKTLPKERGGQHLIGRKFPRAAVIKPDEPATDPSPRATLYRWWTDTCPACRATLPAVEQLRKTYAREGLGVVGVYHPKPPRRVDAERARAAARKLGYHGEVAVDEDWSALRRAYPSIANARATSVTFLVDDRGVIRFFHPGPVYFPSGEADFARENADYLLLEQAVKALLHQDAEPRGKLKEPP